MNTFIIQKDSGAKDFWFDFSSSINITKNEGLVPKAVESQSNISLYETVETRFVFQNHPNNADACVLRKPQDVGNMAVMPFNLNELVESFEKNQTWSKYLLFASPLTNSSTQESVSKNAAFYIRTEDGHVKNLNTGTVHTENIVLIPWFVVFKLEDAQVYYIVLNNKSVTVSNLNDQSEKNKIFVSDYHTGNFGSLIFNPKFSRNVKVVNENFLFVQGDSFTINPLDNWFVNNHATEAFDVKKIKCSTNLEYSVDDNGFHFNMNESDGYIIIRWPHGTSFFHGIYLKSKNSLQQEYIVKRIKI